MTTKKKPIPETISLVPSWRGILPIYLAVLEAGTEKGRKEAREELGRMADAADKYNAVSAAIAHVKGGKS